jgi:hypothetical protein
VNAAEAMLEPLRGKGRTVRQALTEVARRWAAGPLVDAVGRTALEDAVRHLLRRGEIRGELPAGIDAAAMARAYVDALVVGRGAAAVDLVVPSGERAR